MNSRVSAIEALQAKLGYQFKEAARLEEALTHASLSQGSRKHFWLMAKVQRKEASLSNHG